MRIFVISINLLCFSYLNAVSPLAGIEYFTVAEFDEVKNVADIRQLIINQLKDLGDVILFEDGIKKNDQEYFMKARQSCWLTLDIFRTERGQALEIELTLTDSATIDRNGAKISAVIWKEKAACINSLVGGSLSKRDLKSIETLISKFKEDYKTANKEIKPTFLPLPGWPGVIQEHQTGSPLST